MHLGPGHLGHVLRTPGSRSDPIQPAGLRPMTRSLEVPPTANRPTVDFYCFRSQIHFRSGTVKKLSGQTKHQRSYGYLIRPIIAIHWPLTRSPRRPPRSSSGSNIHSNSQSSPYQSLQCQRAVEIENTVQARSLS